MLLSLKIRDFAIIDAVDIDFSTGFTVITGETGAGKSILVDALCIALGGRASAEIIRNGAEAAEVEALFDISAHPVVRARLEQRDLVGDDPASLLVRRVVAAKGRGKVLVNGRLATVATLAEIIQGLVDISGQHEHQSLLNPDGHLELLDAYGRLDDAKSAYRADHDVARELEREGEALRRSEQESLQRADFLRFQLDEIERLDPRSGEDVELENERRRLAHAERLKLGALAAETLLYSEDGSAFDKLGRAAAEVEALLRIDPEVKSVSEALSAARREVQEAAQTLQRYGERLEADPERLRAIEDRLAELKRLARKHGTELSEVLRRADSLREELGGIEHRDQRLSEIDSELATRQGELLVKAGVLSRGRAEAAVRLSREVEKELADMELAGAVFQCELGPRAGGDGLHVDGNLLGPDGLDAVELRWSANRGEPPKPLVKIVSGGELSRLMLALKRVLGGQDLVSLYVFDEVDAGLGGRAADAIGRKIQAVAKSHQAIAITHLAPIAARADHHLSVRKESVRERTVSVLEEVSGPARAEEIARMIGGAKITTVTRQAAHDMLARARE